MTLISCELYDALREAGVADDRAVAAARVTLYGHAPGFIGPLYDALRSVGVSDEVARRVFDVFFRGEALPLTNRR
jgi:hypothetical protein